MYNLYFNDENYNQDKLRAERIIKNINDKFSNNKKEKKELNADERDELLLVRQLLIKILKYQFSL
tara:strand:+ start:1253 stop:1447 length:195 start_codon:yes stop_codon:yes gene_type:complete